MTKHKMEWRETGDGNIYYRSLSHDLNPFYTMIREPFDSFLKSDNGNSLAGKWILRKNINAEIVDFDQYRIDLAERNNLELP